MGFVRSSIVIAFIVFCAKVSAEDSFEEVAARGSFHGTRRTTRGIQVSPPGSPPQWNGNNPQAVYAYNTCFHNCPSTAEYNPCCGTDGVTYYNDSNIKCANRCGKRVSKAYKGTCIVDNDDPAQSSNSNGKQDGRRKNGIIGLLENILEK